MTQITGGKTGVVGMSPLFQGNYSARQRQTQLQPSVKSVQSVVYLLSRFSGLIALLLNAEIETTDFTDDTDYRGKDRGR